jgi:hypothetical protein
MSASSTIIEEIETLRKAGLASVAMFFYDFGEDQRRTYVDRYHRCYPSFATGPIPTTKSFDFQFNTPAWCTEPQQRRNCYMFKGLVESRDLQGLAGPHGFTVRVVAATASGRDIAARAPPVPVLGLCGFFFFFAHRTSEPKKWIVFRLTLVVNAFSHLSAIFLAFSAFCSR